MSSYWTPTPVYSYDDYLEHSGTKGMRWGYNDGRRNGKRTAQEIELDKKIELYKRSYEDNIAKAKEYKAAGDKKNYDIAIRNAYHARNKGIQYTNERKNISNNAGYKIGYALGSGAKKIEDAVKGKSASSNTSKSVSNKSSIDISNSRPHRVASGTAHVSKGRKVNTNGPLGSSKKITRGTGAEPLSAINYEKEPKNNTTEKVVNKIKTVSKKAVSKIESVVKDPKVREAVNLFLKAKTGYSLPILETNTTKNNTTKNNPIKLDTSSTNQKNQNGNVTRGMKYTYTSSGGKERTADEVVYESFGDKGYSSNNAYNNGGLSKKFNRGKFAKTMAGGVDFDGVDKKKNGGKPRVTEIKPVKNGKGNNLHTGPNGTVKIEVKIESSYTGEKYPVYTFVPKDKLKEMTPSDFQDLADAMEKYERESYQEYLKNSKK